ncbi:hypothetical protein [Gemmata sp.]|uniref:hypothetical protein n=1 Tax=Gemmata sp. TaxID=1914242 RepID=UPI003F71F4E1
MRVLDMAEHLTDEQVAQRAAAAERNRRDEEQQRRQRDAVAAAERAKVAAVLDARAGRLAAVAAKLVAKLQADEGLLKWVAADRIIAPGEPLPPADVERYATSIEVSVGQARGDGTGGLIVVVRSADPNVCERLLAEETDPVSAALAGRERVSLSDGPLRQAIHAARVGARLQGSARVDDRVTVASKFDADLGQRVQTVHGHFTRYQTLSVAIGTDPQPDGPTKPARVLKDGWTSGGGRRAGIGAD